MSLVQKKIASIIVVVALYSIFFFLLAALLLSPNGERSGIYSLVVGVVGLTWCALMAGALALIASERFGASLALAVLAPVAAVLVGRASLPAFIGAAILLLTTFLARSIIAREINSRVNFNTRVIFRDGVKVLILGLAVSLLALSFPLLRSSAEQGALTIPMPYVEAIVNPLTPALARYLPGYERGNTINDIIDAQIAKQAADLPAGFVVPPEQRETIRADLSKQLGISIRGDETMPVLVTRYVNQYVKSLAKGDGLLVVIVLLVAALLALRAIIPILAWPVLAVIAALLYLSQRIGLISVIRTQVTIERMRL